MAITEKHVSLLKLCADETRMHVLSLLAKNKNGLSVQELADSVEGTHSAMSHVLSKLYEQQVVKRVRDGQEIHYSLTQKPKTKKILKILKAAGCI